MNWLKSIVGGAKEGRVTTRKTTVVPVESGAAPKITTFRDAYAVAFSPDGERIALGGRGSLAYRNVSGSDAIWVADAQKFGVRVIIIRDLVFTADGKQVISGGANGTPNEGQASIFFWSAQSGKLLKRVDAHGEEVRALKLSPDGEQLASCGPDGLLQVWTPAGKRLSTLKAQLKNINDVAFVADGRILASAAGYVDHIDKSAVQAKEPGVVAFWDLSSGKSAGTITLDSLSSANAIAASPDGKFVAVGLGTLDRKRRSGQAGRVQIFDVDSRAVVEEFTGFTAEVRTVAFSPGGSLLAAGTRQSYEGTSLQVWNVRTKSVVHRDRQGEYISSIRFSPDGQLMIYV